MFWGGGRKCEMNGFLREVRIGWCLQGDTHPKSLPHQLSPMNEQLDSQTLRLSKLYSMKMSFYVFETKSLVQMHIEQKV